MQAVPGQGGEQSWFGAERTVVWRPLQPLPALQLLPAEATALTPQWRLPVPRVPRVRNGSFVIVWPYEQGCAWSLWL